MRKLIVQGSPISEIEIFEFNGGNGPNVVISGAVHGNEQTGVHTARILMNKLSESEVLGNVKVIPVMNPTAYYRRERTSPFDNIDMSRFFPGNPNGSLSLRTADALWKETADAEYIVDLHGCGIKGSPYTLADHEGIPGMKELCAALGMPVVCQTGGTGGQFFLESCYKRGQKSLLIELPGGQPGGVIDIEAAEFCAERLFNYLKYIHAVKGEYTEPNPAAVFCGKIDRLPAVSEGLFLPKVKAGAFVNKGDKLASLESDIFYAPYDARIVSISLPMYAFIGDTLINIMPIK